MGREHYTRLGDCIKAIDTRNKMGLYSKPMGINIDKFFMPSVANVIGTDITNYKVVQQNQFACNFMHVGRDKRLPIALLDTDSPIIVSPAYFVFEIKPGVKLLPSFLMLWFKREEFDRNAWFYTDSDVRGGLDRESFMDMSVPVPPITEQEKILSQYQALSNRAIINNVIISKLEESARSIYKKAFADDIDFGNLPAGWHMGTLRDVADCLDFKRRPMSGSVRQGMEKKYPYYGAAALMDYVEDYIFDGEYVLMGEDGSVQNEDGTPVLQFVRGKMWVNNHAHVLQGKNGFDNNLLWLKLSSTVISDIVTGGVQAKINQENMFSIPVLIPSDAALVAIKDKLRPLFSYWFQLKEENQLLEETQNLILAKLA